MNKKKQKSTKKNGKLVTNILMMFVLIFGIGVLLYPFVYDSLNTILDQQIINYYQHKANQKDQEQTAKAAEAMKKKNDALKHSQQVGRDPFKKKTKKKEVKKGVDYFKKHTIASISIPKIKIKLPVFDETTDVLLSKGATLLEGTSYPIGGKSTHAVISAHRGLAQARLFTDLPKLKKGDYFYLHINHEIHAYKVDSKRVVEPTDTSHLLIVPGQDLVTLLTCTPYMINSHRLLVTGHRVPYIPKKMAKDLQQNNNYQMIRSYLIIGLSVLLLIVFITILWRIIRGSQIARRQYLINLEYRLGGVPVADTKLGLYNASGRTQMRHDGQPIIFTTDAAGKMIDIPLKGGRYTLKFDNNKVFAKLYVKRISDKQFAIKVKRPSKLLDGGIVDYH
ncbi:class C sortase [Lapidilactobacillus bayanensis]|uniref:class C sortase n=1 Tax=Lapidilactobacillus bayanensis TaxID=2485998 RepID=UPI000F7A6634|nr:class C sortase [Lapidilactobacillus bayanensis]